MKNPAEQSVESIELKCLMLSPNSQTVLTLDQKWLINKTQTKRQRNTGLGVKTVMYTVYSLF